MSSKTATTAALTTTSTPAVKGDDAILDFGKANATPHPFAADKSANGTVSRIARLMNKRGIAAPKGCPYWTRIEVQAVAATSGVTLGNG